MIMTNLSRLYILFIHADFVFFLVIVHSLSILIEYNNFIEYVIRVYYIVFCTTDKDKPSIPLLYHAYTGKY